MDEDNHSVSRVLRIQLLGELRLSDASGRALPLPASKKTRALLGYLIATGRPHQRERMCELFWEEGPDDPRAALRWSLSKLRPLVDDANSPRLLTSRDQVAFEAREVEIDIVRIRALLASGIKHASLSALKTAAALFEGELMEGLDLPTCYRFQAWCFAERNALTALRIEVLSALVERLRDQPLEALAYAREWVNVDPLSTAGHCALIRTLGALRGQNEALKYYSYAVRALETQLGVPVEMELHEAARAIRSPTSTPQRERYFFSSG